MDSELFTRIKKSAAYYAKHGYSVIPIGRDKRPVIKSWAHLQGRIASQEEMANWPARHNLGVVTGSISGIVVADFESVADAQWFVANKGDTPLKVRTKRGVHLWFGLPVGGETVANSHAKPGYPYDVRGEGGYVLAPPSYREGHQYHFLTLARDYLERREPLPEFKPEWRPEATSTELANKEIGDGVAYIAKIFAVSGQGGHNETWQAVNRLKDSGLSELEAYAALVEWNQTNAKPPWTTRELLHKVRDAYK